MGCGGSKQAAGVVVPPPPTPNSKNQVPPQKAANPPSKVVKHDDVDIQIISKSAKGKTDDSGAVMLQADLTTKDQSLINDIVDLEASKRNMETKNQESRDEEDAKILAMQMSVAESANDEAMHEFMASQALGEAIALEEERQRVLDEERVNMDKLQAVEEEKSRLEAERLAEANEAKQRELEVSIAAAEAEAAEAAKKIADEELIRKQIEEEQRIALETAAAEQAAAEASAAEEAERLAQLEVEIQKAKEDEEARMAAQAALEREEKMKLEELRQEQARQKAEEDAKDAERKAALAAKKAKEQEEAAEKKKAADKVLVDKMNDNSAPADVPSRVLILYSSLSSDSTQVMNQRRLDDLIKSYKYDYVRVDGASPEMKDLRSKLFDISNQRGKYPQCFVETGDHYEFIGLWDQMESLADCESLPADVLAGNPNIPTLSRMFRKVKKV